MFHSVPGEIGAMKAGQGLKHRRGIEIQSRRGRGCELRRAKGRAVIGETDQAGVEGGVPQCVEKQAVVDVEAEGVGFAFGPRDDVRGAQKFGIGDAGQGAAPSPVFEQGCSENVLADTLDDQPLDFGRARHLGGGLLESFERRSGQAHAQLVNAVQRRVQLAQRGQRVGCKTGAGQSIGRWNSEFGGDGGMGNGEEPGAAAGSAAKPDVAARCGRAVTDPAIPCTKRHPKAGFVGGFMRLLAEDKATRRFDLNNVAHR